ncbi:MAG: T9SS type A sorting domain-containing protein, partial [Bacteroidota bacterium]
VNIGDVLNYTVAITPMVGDENPLDNQFAFHQTVVGSFDPNNIICMEGNVVPPSEIGKYLHYVINFENTGTFEAENIVVRTDIDPTKFDINSLQMLNTSHNAYVRQTGNTIEFIFESIALETGGHGNVLLKMKSKSNLVTGDMVSNRAGIYFDYNAPVDTGLANTTFQALSNSVFEIDDSILVYPNPTASIINIKSNFNIKSIQLYDVQGRLLQTTMENTTNTIIDISQKSNGVYFLKITTDKGSKVEKIIKG